MNINLDFGNRGGAYGGGKAGGAFDLMTFVQRPQVICRALCWVSFSWFLPKVRLSEKKDNAKIQMKKCF